MSQISKTDNLLLPQDRQLSDQQKKVDKQLRDVASLYEKQFLREMMKQMRATVPESELIQTSMGEKIFREQLDDQYVEKWGDQGGIGLGNLIYSSLIEKFGAQFGLTEIQHKVKGPIPLSGQVSGKILNSQKNNQLTYQFEKNKLTGSAPSEVIAPWGGKIQGVNSLTDGQTLVELDHGQNLRSQMLFKGTINPKLSQGSEILKGEKIASLSPDSNVLIWRVNKTSEPPPSAF